MDTSNIRTKPVVNASNVGVDILIEEITEMVQRDSFEMEAAGCSGYCGACDSPFLL